MQVMGENSPNKCVALEESLGVLVVELEKFSGSSSDFGEGQPDSPDLTLIAQAILSSELEFSVKTWSLCEKRPGR